MSGTINLTGIEDSSETLDPSYELGTRISYKLPWRMHLGIEGRYQYLPLKYSLQVLNGTATAFESKAYDIIEQITTLTIKINFQSTIFGDLLPTIGYSQEITNGENKTDSSTYNWTDTRWIIGLNKVF